MASFSIARVPYYIAVAGYSAFAALISFWGNATAVGLASDAHLAIMVGAIVLTLASLFYIASAKAGDDDEVGIQVAGVGIGKQFYYYGVLALAAWRGVVGYQMNHTATGIESTYGVVWLLASIGIGLFTYANYRSFAAKQASKT